MIQIKPDGRVIVPDEEAFIGYEGDNLSATKEFFVEGITEQSYIYRMYLTFDDDSSCYFLLDRTIVDGGTKLRWNVSSEQINKGGIVRMQIKASNLQGVVFHTEPTAMLVQTSIEFAEVYRDKDNAEFLQHERYLNNLIAEADEIYQGLLGENMDAVPTENSTYAVQSSGIYHALAEKVSFELISKSNGSPLELSDLNNLTPEIGKLYYVLIAGSVLYSGAYPCRCLLAALTDTNQIVVDINGRCFSRYKDVSDNWSSFTESTSALDTRVSTLESTVGTANAALEAVLLGA